MNKYNNHNWNKLFTYNKITGDLKWKITSRRAQIGKIAGCLDKNNYIVISYKGIQYLAHQIIWCIIYGKPANSFIDHKDTDPSNNNWNNLRLITRSLNALNRHKYSGVHQLQNGKWRANITINGIRNYSRGFETYKEAVEYRKLLLNNI